MSDKLWKVLLLKKQLFHTNIFIGEDFSTDSTRIVCLKLKDEYPDKIELLLFKFVVKWNADIQSLH